VDLDVTEDQAALRAILTEFFEKESPVPVVRAAEPLGFDAELWRKVVDMGLPPIAVPEDRGGGGAGFIELAIAAELLGRSLAPVPLIEAAVATALLARPGRGRSGDGAASLLADVVAGGLVATLALKPVHEGVARLVPAGAVADVVVVLRGDELVAVRMPERPAGIVANLGAMPVADCRVEAGEAIVLAEGPGAVAAHRRAVHRWQLLTAAALVGIGSRALELGVDYVQARPAFGVLIGTFQSIQHRLADDATALEGARLLAYKAAWAQDVDLPVAGTVAAMSFLFAADTAFRTASDSLHVHGGYGYTLEYDVQLYFRRARAWPLIAGDRRAAYAELAHRLFDAREG
jgi:alkylation response protein AidB-like acyl-CoA dehydrogenase